MGHSSRVDLKCPNRNCDVGHSFCRFRAQQFVLVCDKSILPTTLIMVKWTGKLAVLALVVSLWASPLMACMLPGALLTVEERECCKHMADDCGQMDMPSSHSCCKVVVKQADSCLVKSRFQTVPVSPDVTLCVATVDHSLPANAGLTKTVFAGHSPPVSPPETISILRI
jgi:hypothetical protein